MKKIMLVAAAVVLFASSDIQAQPDRSRPGPGRVEPRRTPPVVVPQRREPRQVPPVIRHDRDHHNHDWHRHNHHNHDWHRHNGYPYGGWNWLFNNGIPFGR